MQETLHVREFDPSTISDEAVCVLIGKRKSGKSCAIRDIMYHKRNIPVAQVISGSEEANPFFHEFVPSSYIETKCTPDLLNAVLSRQTKVKQLDNQQQTHKLDTRLLLCLDDCLHDSSWQRLEQIKKLFMLGRHYGIFLILSLQYVFGIGPQLRTNSDYIFIFRDASIQNRHKLYKNFGANIPTFPMFCSLLNNLSKYEALVICTDADKVDFQDQVMYWKPKLRDPFRFGCQSYWERDAYLKQWRENQDKSEHTNYQPNQKNAIQIVRQE